MDYSVDDLKFFQNVYNAVRDDYLQNRLKTIAQISPYSQKINNYVFTVKEIELYRMLALKECRITRPVLVVDEIEINYIDPSGLTNLQRMLSGKPPFDPKTQTPYLLHHIGQQYESPFAELTYAFHSMEHYGDLHKLFVNSWRADRHLNDLTKQEFKQHWIQRGRFYAEHV